MPMKKYDWFDISKQQREEWEKLCPANEFRVIKSLDLPKILPKSLTDKFDSVFILASGSYNDTIVYYMANGNRVDYKAGKIDQQPLGLAFVGPDPIPSGSLIQHGDWEDRNTTPPEEFWQYLAESGIGNVYPLTELPEANSGKLSELKVQSQKDAFNNLVAELRQFIDPQLDHTDKESMRRQLEEAKKDIQELGGLDAFKSGKWLLELIKKSFKNYWERANANYFRSKYPSKDTEFIVNRLTEVAARNAGILGALTGVIVSADEIVGFFPGGKRDVGIRANIAIALTAIASEAVVLVQLQLLLVANIGKLYGVRLDPDDPEDILTILAFAVGGAAAEEAGRFGMKVGGNLAANLATRFIREDVLRVIKRIGTKLGIKILQRTILKYVVPLASVLVGSGWNYIATKSVGKIAQKHFIARFNDRAKQQSAKDAHFTAALEL